MKIYSDIVEKYYNYKQDNTLIIADDIMVKDGVACGDFVPLIGELDEGIMEFKFVIKGCILCKAVANFLCEKYSCKDIDKTIEELKLLINKIKCNREYLLDMFDVHELANRFQCLYSPFEMLYSFATQLKNKKFETYEREDTLQSMDCDACVVTGDMNWGGRNETVKKKVEVKRYSVQYKKDWGTVSKLYLNADERELLKELYVEMTDIDFEYLRREKMEQTVYSNLIKNHIDISTNINWKNIIYQIQRQHIVKGEVERIKKYITNNDLKLYMVKGGYNNQLYTDKDVRVHLDYDFVAMSNRDAFYFASHLFDLGYTVENGIFSNFSLKMIENNGKTLYSGHYHVQKVFNSQYKLVFDVNFPGFPMGRVDLFFPQIVDKHISDEDQFVITLCHVFKHKVVFMKDINDIYLMLKKRNLNYGVLKKRLEENKLQDSVSILLMYIFENYDLDNELKSRLTKELDLDLNLKLKNWPFDSEKVLDVKKHDLQERMKTMVDNQRVYLYPLAIFKKFQELDEDTIEIFKQHGYDIQILDENVCQIHMASIDYYIFGMGIFIDTYLDVTNISRNDIRLEVTKIMQSIDANDMYDIPYEVNPLEKWYF